MGRTSRLAYSTNDSQTSRCLTFTRVGCLCADLGRFVYIAFVVDVFAQWIVGWHAATSKVTDLVMIPLRMALWQRSYEGHPAELGQLIHHSDAGSQYTSIRFTDHLRYRADRPLDRLGRGLLRL
jgi:transposase InsO family protein